MNMASVNKTEKFSKLKKISLADQIANQILEMINQGILVSGEKIPSERDLAKMLGVSRIALREALKSLKTLSILYLRAGDGYYVNNLNSFSLLRSLDFELNDTEKLFFSNLQSVRIAIEVGAVEQACMRRTQSDIDDITTCLEAMVEDSRSEESQTALHDSVRFHNAIISASKNPIYIAIMDCLQESLQKARETRMHAVEKQYTEKSYQRSIEEHKEILEAIIASDSATAKKKMEAHLRRSFSLDVE